MGTARDHLGSRADAVTGESASDSMVDLHLGMHRGDEIWAAWEYWRGIEASRPQISLHCGASGSSSSNKGRRGRRTERRLLPREAGSSDL